jgi:hypothetical protein
MKICFFLISTTFSMLILQIFNDIVQVWDEIMVESAEMAAAPGASPPPTPSPEGRGLFCWGFTPAPHLRPAALEKYSGFFDGLSCPSPMRRGYFAGVSPQRPICAQRHWKNILAFLTD